MNLKAFVVSFFILILSTGYSCANCNTKQNEVEILARVIYTESRGTSFKSMQMVGEVILNRVESLNFPDSICDVALQSGQFKLLSHIKEKDQWELSLFIADSLIKGTIPYIDNNAVYFLKRGSKLPKWVTKVEKVAVIGNQIFYADNSAKVEIYKEKDKLSPL